MRWIRFGKRDTESSLEQSLAELERRAAEASDAYAGQFFARAGALCADAGDRTRALKYWGQAINSYLRTARPRAAATVCRKMIAFAPDVVRARRTLALLAIGEGRTDEALQEVEEYTRAAQRAGPRDLVIKQLRLMGEASWSERFRRRIAELLTELGDVEGAEYVARPLSQPHAAHEQAIPDQAHDRWSTILRVALMSPDEAREAL